MPLRRTACEGDGEAILIDTGFGSGDIFMFGAGRNFPAYACSMDKLIGLAVMAGRVEGEPRSRYGNNFIYYSCGCAAFLDT